MESVSARLNSFKKSKRVKNPDKPSSTATLKWPHPSDFKANPETLAEAGFYYDPAYGDSDNVTCYICEKQLGGWEVDDDPFLLHWKKCGQHCCWASVRCGLVSEVDASGGFVSLDKTRHPTHKAMEKARLETFGVGKGWIHDKVKGHGANSTMMARAGFVYTPQHSGDDLATCLYCNTSLSGWDEEDDPMEEHRKRASKLDFPCAFFSISEPSRSQATKPPSKSQAKPPSRSTSKSKYQDAVIPTKTFDGEEEDSDVVEPAKTAKSTAKTPRKPRSTSTSTTRKSSAKTPKPKSRSTSRSGLKDVAEDDEEGDIELEPPATVKKKARSGSKSVVRSDVQTEDDEDAELQPPPTVKKKPRSRSKSAAKEVVEIDDENDSQIEPPATVKKKSSRTQSKSIPKSDVEPERVNEQETRKPSRSKTRKPAEQIEDEVEEQAPKPRTKSKAAVAAENEEIPRKPSRSKAKPSVAPSADDGPRKVSRTKPNSKALDSGHEEISEATAKFGRPPSRYEEAPKPPAKPKHQRAASKSTAKALIAVSEAESIDQDEPVTVVQPDKKGSDKPKPAQPVVAADLFNGGVMDSHDAAPSPPLSSKSVSTTELPPLFVPKRKTASAAPSKSSSHSTAREKLASKLKPVSKTSEPMKVVEISSDEESDASKSEKENNHEDGPQRTQENTHMLPKAQTLLQPSIPQSQFSTPPRPVSAQSKFRKKPIIVETVQPPETARSPSLPLTKPQNNGDVSMGDVESDVDQQMDDDPAPSTPPRPTIPLTPPNGIVPTVTQPDSKHSPTPPNSSQDISVEAQAVPPFMPPLSRLPFAPLHSLSDAELDMTVEEWIRYQMEVEFDKFRRDGERELQQFRKKAEDVRKIIEGL